MKLKQLFETELYKFYCSKSNGFITSAASLTPEVISTMKKHSEKTGYPVEVKKDGKVVGKITKSGMEKLNESEITKGKTK
jgi:hypothetical protein